MQASKKINREEEEKEQFIKNAKLKHRNIVIHPVYEGC
jgi:hypothetical protein